MGKRREGTSVKSVRPVWQRITVDKKRFGTTFLKAALDIASQDITRLPERFIDLIESLKLKAKEPGELAQQLLERSLTEAMLQLTLELGVNGDKLKPELIEQIRYEIEKLEIDLYPDFLEAPQSIIDKNRIKDVFADLLSKLTEATLYTAMAQNRLTSQFVFSLHREWSLHAAEYEPLKDALNTPFAGLEKMEWAWQCNHDTLQLEIEKPLFGEPYSLKQLYVPLNCYNKTEIEEEKSKSNSVNPEKEKKFKYTVTELENELESWIEKKDRDDAIRILSGGPGSGKSSVAKVFAAKRAALSKENVLYIPLHRFAVEGSFSKAVDGYIKDMALLPENPLENQERTKPILFVFDGLDELSHGGGKAGLEIAKDFVEQVYNALLRLNDKKSVGYRIVCWS